MQNTIYFCIGKKKNETMEFVENWMDLELNISDVTHS